MGCTPGVWGVFAENPPLMVKRCSNHNQHFITPTKAGVGDISWFCISTPNRSSPGLPLREDLLLPSSGAEVGRNSGRFPWAEPCPGWEILLPGLPRRDSRGGTSGGSPSSHTLLSAMLRTVTVTEHFRLFQPAN